MKKIKSKNIFDNIREWAKKRELLKKGDPKTQTIKLMEEVGELSNAILKEKRKETIDALGDIIIVLTNLAKMLDLNIEFCIEQAYKEITNRKGIMKNGTFQKENK